MRPQIKTKSTTFHAGLALPAIGDGQIVITGWTPTGIPEYGTLDVLHRAAEKMAPIPLQMWMQASGITQGELYELVVKN